jgi:thiopeptide-type bacteriocin biosynthesis protein
LTETPPDRELGWIGHAHELTLPLTSVRAPLPHPDIETAPVIRNRMLPPPGAAGQRWTQAKLFTHPSPMDQILTRRLPELLSPLGGPASWFVRYRTSQEDDHLRLRIATPGRDAHATVAGALADWTAQLQRSALASRLVVDGYRPEFGRYGTGPALEAAEAVFVADSDVARCLMTDLPETDRRVLVALGMIDVATGLLGAEEGTRWLATTAAAATGRRDVTRAVLDEVRVQPLGPRPGWTGRIDDASRRRRAALGAYRAQLDGRRIGAVLESLLHMHHNRLMGPDRETEAVCRHAARQACRSLVAQGLADE